MFTKAKAFLEVSLEDPLQNPALPSAGWLVMTTLRLSLLTKTATLVGGRGGAERSA